MSNSIFSNDEFFSNSQIHFKDKIAMAGLLSHGVANLFKKGNEDTMQILFFGNNKQTNGVITVTFGEDASMGKNNCMASIQGSFGGTELADLFKGLTDNNFNVSNKTVFENLINTRTTKMKMNLNSLKSEWDNFLKDRYYNFAEHCKKEYPGIVTDESIHNFETLYLETIDELLKKKQSQVKKTNDEAVMAN